MILIYLIWEAKEEKNKRGKIVFVPYSGSLLCAHRRLQTAAVSAGPAAEAARAKRTAVAAAAAAAAAVAAQTWAEKGLNRLSVTGRGPGGGVATERYMLYFE